MRIFLLTAIFIFDGMFSFCQDITGNWRGNIEANGQQIPIVFHFYKDSSGKIGGKWESPTQNAKNLPCSDILIKNFMKANL
jgi:hypothetical protein